MAMECGHMHKRDCYKATLDMYTCMMETLSTLHASDGSSVTSNCASPCRKHHYVPPPWWRIRA